MAVELVHGPQISGEHPLVEKEIPSLLNRFSKNFRGVITSCLQKYPNDVRKLMSAGAMIIDMSLATCFYAASNSCSTAKSPFHQKDEENNSEGP